jgi:transcriptional regulator with XRE-family HTH domain
MTPDEMKKILLDMVAERGSQKEVADILQITPAYLSDILNGNRSISNAVSKKIGYFKKTVYEPMDGIEQDDSMAYERSPLPDLPPPYPAQGNQRDNH